MQHKAVIDRFEEEKAVLLVGDAQVQVIWPRDLLPADAAEGDYLQIMLLVDQEATQAAREEAEQLLCQLLKENGSKP